MAEWIKFSARSIGEGLRGILRFPANVCGIFCVLKADGRLRFIFDGRPSNAPHGVSLPQGSCTPAALGDMELPPGGWWLCKKGIVSFYFNLRNPAWMKKWHVMPAILWKGLKRMLGGLAHKIQYLEGGFPKDDDWVYPYLETLPMGYVHSQYCAQNLHERVSFAYTDLAKAEQLVDGFPRTRSAPV